MKMVIVKMEKMMSCLLDESAGDYLTRLAKISGEFVS